MGSGGDLLVVHSDLLDAIDIRRTSIHRRQEFRRIEPLEGSLSNLEQCPDDRRGRVDLFEAFGGADAQPRRRKGGLDHVGGSQMPPMFPRELVEGDQPLPVMCQALDCLRGHLAVALVELRPELLARRLALRIGHRTAQRTGLGLMRGGDRNQHVGAPMVPAALLRGSRLLLGQGRPDIYDLQVIEPPLFSGLILQLPVGLQPCQRGGRERRPLTQQSAQGQLAIAQGQAMQVELRQPVTHLPGPSLKQEQDPTDKALAQPQHPRPTHGDRPQTQTQPPGLAITVTQPLGHIDRGPTGRFGPTQQRGDLLFQEYLDEVLNLLPYERFQAVPDRA